jgi:hypothetical protein
VLQMIPGEPVDAARIDGAGSPALFRYILFPYLRPTLVVAGLFRLIDRSGRPADLRTDQWRTRHGDRADQLLRHCRIVQFLLLGLRQCDCDLDGRGRIAVELNHRPPACRGRAR